MAKDNAIPSMSLNGQADRPRNTFRKPPSLPDGQPVHRPDPAVDELSEMIGQFQERLNRYKTETAPVIETSAPPQRRRFITTSTARWRGIAVVVVVSILLGVLYNYIVENDLSLKPIDLAAAQKVLLNIVVYFVALGCVERGLKYFVPVVHHYFVNDNGSEQDFSEQFDGLITWQKHLFTAFYVGLFLWAFVQLLQVKY